MVWQLKEPAFGDIIKAKAGILYHFGIFASENEVIQFGLSPLLRGASFQGVKVLSTNLETFACGNPVEVGVPSEGDLVRFTPQKTVEIARSRIGEEGYHILYNNCEQFAYECLCGQRYCSQMESVRDLFKGLTGVDVYVALIPEGLEKEELSSPLRQAEIDGVSNPQVKLEKYCVWKLLERALKKSYALNAKNVTFKKLETGKWVCDRCEFSLSHSKNAVCVALSKSPVGVDIEAINPTKVNALEKVLTESELSRYEKLDESEKVNFLFNAWTKKESLFKTKNKSSFSINELKVLNGNVYQKTLTLGESDYSLSVATDLTDKVRVFVEELN